ncbi:MAG: electron transport complex subunit RsxC [Gammaproteobacteria bacterium]|nr:electron transport complex subunit RsxC [Gammaproteobacteria bacterium]
MMRALHAFPGGLHLETHKEKTCAESSLLQPLPERIVLPLQQHIGLPAEPIVGMGERVRKGQMIARASGYVSVPVHASTSGTIVDIGLHPVGNPATPDARCIVIEPDGRDEWFEIQPVHEYASVDPRELQAVIRDCGIAGLGGAGFPTHVKLNEGVENAVDTLIINGVECEPYITCDDRLIQEKATYVVAGARMIAHAVQAKHCVIAVEEDMPQSFAALEKLVEDDIELVKVPTRYPAGGEKQLIKMLTGFEVPSGGLSIHIGIVVHNVATAAAVYRAVTRGEPQVSRYVTVTGDVDRPRNLQVLLGTPIHDCLRTCGFREDGEARIILGGPMMGTHLRRLDIPVIKTTNCVLVQPAREPAAELPCIRCGDCVDVCPIKLLPQQLYWHARSDDQDEAQRYHLFDCIECGCCAYVCPSHIPLVQYYRHAKSRIAAAERQRQGADHARTRFLARNARLDRQERSRNGALPAAAGADIAEKRAYISDAVERVRDRRLQRDPNQGGDD